MSSLSINSVPGVSAGTPFKIAYTNKELSDRARRVHEQFLSTGGQSSIHSSWSEIRGYDVKPIDLKKGSVDALIWEVLKECRKCSKKEKASIQRLETLLDNLFLHPDCSEETYDKVLQELWQNANHAKIAVENPDGSITYVRAPFKNAQLIELLEAEGMAAEERVYESQNFSSKDPQNRPVVSLEQSPARSCRSSIPSFGTVVKAAFLALALGLGAALLNSSQQPDVQSNLLIAKFEKMRAENRLFEFPIRKGLLFASQVKKNYNDLIIRDREIRLFLKDLELGCLQKSQGSR